jgi:hypothetical protein
LAKTSDFLTADFKPMAVIQLRVADSLKWHGAELRVCRQVHGGRKRVSRDRSAGMLRCSKFWQMWQGSWWGMPISPFRAHFLPCFGRFSP